MNIPPLITNKPPAERINDQNREDAYSLLERQRRMVSCWSMYLSYSETQDRTGDEGAGVIGPGVPEWHFRCMDCGQSIIRVYTGGNPIRVNLNMILDRYTAHGLRCHQERLPPNVSYNPEQNER